MPNPRQFRVSAIESVLATSADQAQRLRSLDSEQHTSIPMILGVVKLGFFIKPAVPSIRAK